MSDTETDEICSSVPICCSAGPSDDDECNSSSSCCSSSSSRCYKISPPFEVLTDEQMSEVAIAPKDDPWSFDEWKSTKDISKFRDIIETQLSEIMKIVQAQELSIKTLYKGVSDEDLNLSEVSKDTYYEPVCDEFEFGDFYRNKCL